MRFRIALALIIAVSAWLLLSLSQSQPVQAQTPPPAIDLMVIIDNSGSMFALNAGNDPEFLRLTGAKLFMARLGFGQSNEAAYQLGLVNLGSPSTLISPLGPLLNRREALAQAIANPQPSDYTELIPALELAYTELSQSPPRQPANHPAIVLLTDGRPNPPLNQSEADIRRLLAQHPTVPLFVILLQNTPFEDLGYADYIRFWQNLAQENPHIVAYHLRHSAEIPQTYNAIIAQLQNTIPARSSTLQAGQSLPIYVNEYVQDIILTLIHPSNTLTATSPLLRLSDPTGAAVQLTQPGVSHYRSAASPIEVISIGPPRLQASLKNATWTLTSTLPVHIFLDRRGAYNIQFSQPAALSSTVPGIYHAPQLQLQGDDLPLTFSLQRNTGATLTQSQALSGTLISPSGQPQALPGLSQLHPTASGQYHTALPIRNLHAQHGPGRYTLYLAAGQADPHSPAHLPIATARLSFNLPAQWPQPPQPHLENSPLVCKFGQNVSLSLSFEPEPTRPRPPAVTVHHRGHSVSLLTSQQNHVSGDVTSLCQTLLEALPCGQRQSASVSVTITSTHQFTSSAITQSQTWPLPLHLESAACPTTATTAPPTATATATLTPVPPQITPTATLSPTLSPAAAPSQPASRLNPDWLLLIATLGLIFGGVGWFKLWPWWQVRRTPPPPIFGLACHAEQTQRGPRPEPLSLRQMGLNAGTNRLIVGSDPKQAHWLIPTLKPTEFIIAPHPSEAQAALILDAESGFERATVRPESPCHLPTSQPGLTLILSHHQRLTRC